MRATSAVHVKRLQPLAHTPFVTCKHELAHLGDELGIAAVGTALRAASRRATSASMSSGGCPLRTSRSLRALSIWRISRSRSACAAGESAARARGAAAVVAFAGDAARADAVIRAFAPARGQEQERHHDRERDRPEHRKRESVFDEGKGDGRQDAVHRPRLLPIGRYFATLKSLG